MPTVSLNVWSAVGTPPANVTQMEVRVKIVGASASEPVYGPDGKVYAFDKVYNPDSAGLVTFTAAANSTLTPSDSYYRITINPKNREKAKVFDIVVTATPSTQYVEDILHDPGTITTSALAAHIATIKHHTDVSDTAPTAGQVLIFDGTTWVPGDTVATDIEAAALVTAHNATGVHVLPQPPIIGSGATQAVAGNDARLTDTRTPTDSSVTNAKVAADAAIAETKLSLASDAAAGTASRRTLGTGATQAAAGNHTHTKGDVGLGNVDNVADLDKPVSTATQTALDAKAASVHNHDDRYFTEAEVTALLAARVINRTVSAVTVVNTTSDTNLYNFTVPGGTLGTTGTFELSASGTYLNNSGAASNLTMRLKFGATTVLVTPARSLVNSATRRKWKVEVLIHANAATNSQKFTGDFKISFSNTEAWSQMGSWLLARA